MVGTMPPRVASRQNKSTTEENVATVEETHGDGPWVQPGTETLITSPGVTLDPNVLENLMQSRKTTPTPPPRAEKSPNASSTVAGRRGHKPPSRTVKVRASTPVAKSTPTSVKATSNASGISPSPIKKIEDEASINGNPEKVTKRVVDRDLATNGHSEAAYKQKEVEKEPAANTEEKLGASDVVKRSTEPAPRFALESTQPVPERRDAAVLGRDLYMRFLHEEMRTVHVREPPSMDPWREARLDLGYSQSLTASVRIRKNLRVVADAFAASEQRELVRHRASRVDIQTLDCASFHELLASLFQEGKVTSERVVVLFYFCADLTIRALSEKLTHCFHQLVDWTQVYIVDTFSVWVQLNGGWSAILDDSANLVCTAAKVGVACIAIVALVALIRRSR